MTDRRTAAKRLASAHVAMEPTIVRVVEVRDDLDAAIKLIEVNEATEAAGIVPVTFGPSDDVPFPSVVVEVTPREWAAIETGKLRLPNGWELGETLFEAEHVP